MDLIQQRLANQGLAQRRFRRPAEVVVWMGAVQAQEHQPSKWALGLRMRNATDENVERALTDGAILRTHVLRPTWHYVAAEDLIWMQRLTSRRVQRAMQPYWQKMELDAGPLRRAAAIFERSLRDGQHLTRAQLGERLGRAGMPLSGYRLAHATLYAELQAVVCSGARAGKQSTYALVADRAPRPRDLSGDEALAELARRFLRSHGPATIRDFVWWSSLLTAEARRAFDMIGAKARAFDGHTYWTVGSGRASRAAADLAYLLPIYDEYMVAYRDRALVPYGPAKVPSARGYVTFQHALVIDGLIAGTWRTVRTALGVAVTVTPLRRLAARERRGIDQAVAGYERFLGTAVSVKVESQARG